MSPNDRDKPTTELESMYREHGDVEPDPGLDRIIRARADAAAKHSHRRRPAPWIGGLVTASVAVVAIAVVLRQAPTAPVAAPEPVPPAAPSKADAPASRAGAALESRTETLRRSRTPEPAENDAEPAELRQRDAFSVDRSAIAEESRGASADTSGQAADRETAAAAADRALPGTVGDPESMIESIRELIEQGEIDRARERAEALQRLHPAHALPEDVRELLPGPTGEADG